MKWVALIFSALVLTGCGDTPHPAAAVANNPEQQIRTVVDGAVREMVGAKSVSAFKTEKSLRTDGSWLVFFSVDGQNKLGGPVRERFTGRAERTVDTWRLVDIEGASEPADRVSR